jgi:Uma2 family endonuclease
VIRGQLSDYANRHPQIGDMALVIEVADTTFVTDRFKAQLYAQAGIPVYWIVNLSERVIEVMQEPKSSAGSATYEIATRYLQDDYIPVVIEGNTVGKLLASDLIT